MGGSRVVKYQGNRMGEVCERKRVKALVKGPKSDRWNEEVQRGV